MELPPPVNDSIIEDQVQRILAFSAFDKSQVLTGFLKFIVAETLAGRELSLKEYTIGTNVLSKKTGYDPQADASVRIHAGRLRRALNDYYDGPGAEDPVYISIPKGTYVPKFQTGVPVIAKPIQNIVVQYKPTLAVLPFHFQDENSMFMLADGLCDQICTEFTQFNELSIISYYSSRKISERVTDIKEAGLLLDANYLLTGSIQSIGDLIRIRVQLTQTETQRQVWASSFEKERSAMDSFHIQDDIVRHVVNQIAGSHGIIFREAARVSPGTRMPDIKVYDAIFWYYHMVNQQNEVVFNKALKSMKEAVELDPHYALGWAVLGETYVAGYFNGFDSHLANPLEEAVRCGKESLKNDFRCHHAYQALGLAYVFLHKREECLKIIDQWVELRSNAAAISGGLGLCLVCLGEFERGHSMLADSIHLNPYYPWWFNGGLSFYHFHKGEYEDAIYWAEKLHPFSPRWELVMKVASYVEGGELAEAKECADMGREAFPEVLQHTRSYVEALLNADDLVNRLVAAFEKVK